MNNQSSNVEIAKSLLERMTGSVISNISGSNSMIQTSSGPENPVPTSLNCQNLTRLLYDYIQSMSVNVSNKSDIASSTSIPATGPGSKADHDQQRDAVMYIVVVLFFYSFGIGFMMIKYMRKEAKEQEECKMYRRYINAAHEQYLNSTNRARLANRLALQALNTVNAIPQTTQLGSKVTFV